MRPSYLRTDEREDLISSLKLVDLSCQQLAADLQYWKWTLVGVHSSLQAAMVFHLSFGNDLLVARPKDAERWLEAYHGDEDYPDMHMDYFMDLYSKTKSEEVLGFRITIDEHQDDSVRRLLNLRNDFIHFMPKGWSIQLAGLPRICLDALDVVSRIAQGPIQMRWGDDDQKARFQDLMVACSHQLATLKGRYEDA